MTLPRFFTSIRARLLLIALLLLTIPLIGFRFIQEMDGYLREGQRQVVANAAQLLSATLSDRPQLFQVASGEDAVEETERRRLLAVFGSADPEAAADLDRAYLPSPEIEKILGVVARNAARIWVVDAHSRVRGLAGSLSAPPGADAYAKSKTVPVAETGWGAKFYAIAIRPMLRWFTTDASLLPHEDPSKARLAVMSQVDRALVGEPNVRWREASKGGATIVAVAQPIWQSDNIIGAVVVEETAGSGQSIKTAALESLLATTLVVFAVGFVALLVFAWRLAHRVQRLQSEADRAIDAHGRIRGDIAGTGIQDEIGALARTLNSTLQRLKRYNDYLETMAARLAHELRTPVAVVRSSLDNLRQVELPAPDRKYIDRADEGISRMSALISRMSEATQLESMLRQAERRRFDIAGVVGGSIEGYRLAYPHHAFEFTVEGEAPMRIDGIADAIAQLLDKLVQNAVDFSIAEKSIRIGLSSNGRRIRLSVENDGPTLPEDVASHLFVSMVSSRQNAGVGSGHLGLGLYIVRLIAEFHGGTVNANNLAHGDGVRFVVTIPRG